MAVAYAASEPFFGFPSVTSAPSITLISPGRSSLVEVTPFDRTVEPDILTDYTLYNRFLARQDRIRAQLDASSLVAQYGDVRVPLSSTSRGLLRLGPEFWLQIAVGLLCFIVGAWVWRMRPADRAAQMFAIASLAVLIAAYPSAIYTTRELALPGGLFRFLAACNHIGAGIFGAAMVSLLLVYPRRLAGDRWIAAVFAVQCGWIGADILGILPNPQVGAFFFILLSFGAIIILAAAQYAINRHDPTARTAMRWFGLSMLVGSGIPILLIVAPPVFGQPVILTQSYAFGFFPLIHAGTAVAIARYRLFDLDRWSFWILFYLLGAVTLLAMDAALVAFVDLDRGAAFSMALLAVVLGYLPLRDWANDHLLGRRGAEDAADMQSLLDLVLMPDPRDQRNAWMKQLERAFRPAAIEAGTAVDQTSLLDHGAALQVPAVGPLPPLLLVHAARGRHLFGTADVWATEQMVVAVRSAFQSRDAFERGVLEERGRIELDVHDNLGIQLLRALHCNEPARKNAYIRDAIGELRDIVGNRREHDMTLEAHLAELRLEIADAAELAGVRLVWHIDLTPVARVSTATLNALRSVLRETVSNALKHARPQTIEVSITSSPDNCLRLRVEDDGSGFDPDAVTPGRGLANGRERLAAMRGSLAIVSGPEGTIVDTKMPLGPAQ